MRRVLHSPEFQTAEALWRSVDLLVRRIETGAQMQIVLYDISAEELAADLATGETLDADGPVFAAGRAARARCGPGRAVAGGRALSVGADAAACGPAGAHGAAVRCGGGAVRLRRSARTRSARSRAGLASADPAGLERAARAAGRRLSGPGHAAVPAADAVRQADRPDRRVRVRGVHPPGRAVRHALGQPGGAGGADRRRDLGPRQQGDEAGQRRHGR